MPLNSPSPNNLQLATITFAVSSFCDQGGCVGVATLPDGRRAVRDMKFVDGPVLLFSAAEWSAFMAGARNGEFG